MAALLSVDKKVRYPDDQLEKPQRMQKSIAPPVRAPDFHQSNNQSSPVEESRRWKSPVSSSIRMARGCQYYCPQGGEVVAQVPNCVAFSPRLAHCGFRGLRPGIPIERDHAVRSKAATCSDEGGRGSLPAWEWGQISLGASRLARRAVIFRMLSPLSARR
jgi:hypothetical protein